MSSRSTPLRRLGALLTLFLVASCATLGGPRASLRIRGREQGLHLYGPRGGPPVVLSSGDLGWGGLAVTVAKLLAARGYFVVGLSSRAYLQSFTRRDSRLVAAEVPGDYAALVSYAQGEGTRRPLLVGVSEGAGLAVLAASGEALRGRVRGVVAIGLCDENELGWRWRDITMYLTRRPPSEPSFLVSQCITSLRGTPLAEIHSSHDAWEDAARSADLAKASGGPVRQWVVAAKNHRFGGNRDGFERSLIEALSWIESVGP